jgi:hypothetical protein
MTEPKTYTLDVPGAVLSYDIRADDSLGAVIGIGSLSCLAVPLLPRQAQARAGH